MEYRDRRNDELKERLSTGITLTDTVNEKVEEAYAQIRRQGQAGKVKHYKRPRKTVVLLAACVGVMATSVLVAAATGFFTRDTQMEEDMLTYAFDLDYDLKPGTFEVIAQYIPEGYVEGDTNKYWPEDNWGHGFTLMPILNTADLEREGNKIQENNVENVEHATLSGMEADVITFKEADRYEAPTVIFLFNPQEGYVLEVWGDYNVPQEELVKVADSLTVERIGDAEYDSEEEKARAAEELQQEESLQAEIEEINSRGVAAEHVIPVGTAYTLERENSRKTFTVEEAEITDTLENYVTGNFYDYSLVEPWLLEDGSLRPYTRQHYENDTLLDEETVEQCFLRVKVKVSQELLEGAEDWDREVALDARIQRLGDFQGNSYQWPTDYYQPVPSEHNFLHIDDNCVYLDQPANLEGEERAHSFFWRTMDDGEELEYEIIFVLDKDLSQSNLALSFNAFANPGTAEGIFFSIF